MSSAAAVVTSFITEAGFIGVPVWKLTSGAPPSAGATSRLTCDGEMRARASAAVTEGGMPVAAEISASSGVGASSNAAWTDADDAVFSEGAGRDAMASETAGPAPELQATRNNPTAARHVNSRLARHAAGRKRLREGAAARQEVGIVAYCA